MKGLAGISQVMAVAGWLAACSNPLDRGVYTLYRTSVAIAGKVHVATFDASEGEGYNRQNCELAARLFNQQPGIQTRFFCEAGRHR